MKTLFLYLLIMISSFLSVAQNDFIGIASYRMTVEGSSNSVTDSMSVIFGRYRIKVILYMPDLEKPGVVIEKVFIDDFITKKSMVLNNTDKSYKIDSLKNASRYDFVNTNKIAASGNNILCFNYKANSYNFDTTVMLGVDCLGSIDHRNSFINNYFFLGVQPLIIDNRIVMEYVVNKPGGVKQRTGVYEIKKMDDVEDYFDLSDYTEVK